MKTLIVFLILMVISEVIFAHGSDPNIDGMNVIGMHLSAAGLGIFGYFIMLKEFPQKLLGWKNENI